MKNRKINIYILLLIALFLVLLTFFLSFPYFTPNPFNPDFATPVELTTYGNNKIELPPNSHVLKIILSKDDLKKYPISFGKVLVAHQNNGKYHYNFYSDGREIYILDYRNNFYKLITTKEIMAKILYLCKMDHDVGPGF